MSYFRARFSDGLSHVEIRVRVEERDHQRVLEIALAELESFARTANDVRRLRHVLHAAGENRRRFVELNLFRGVDHGLDARAAETIDGERRHRSRQSRFQSDVTRAINRIGRGLECVADDDMIDLLAAEAAARKRFLRREHAEVDGADVAEVSVVFGHRRTGAVDDDDFFHWVRSLR